MKATIAGRRKAASSVHCKTAWHGVAGRPRSPCRRRRALGRAGHVPTVPCVRKPSDYCEHHAV
eukprot:5034258-Prymnesium_polylepis.1